MMAKSRQTRSHRHLDIHIPNRKFKLSKSPQHTLTSIQSARTLSEISPQLKSIKKRNLVSPKHNKNTDIIVRDQILLQALDQYPLKEQLTARGQARQERKVLVVSKIQDFYEEYNTHFGSSYCRYKQVFWVILTNATNNQSNQRQFNQLYDPVVFKFVRTITEIANIINFSLNQLNNLVPLQIQLGYFHKIVNFNALVNDYASIYQQQSLNLIDSISAKIAKEPQLWMILQQDLTILKKYTKSNHFYFLDAALWKQKKLQLSLTKGNPYLFILANNHQQFIDNSNIQQLQQNLDDQKIKKILQTKHDHTYFLKICRKYLLGQPIINLIVFPQKLIQYFSQQFRFVINNSQQLKDQNSVILNVYYQQKHISDPLSLTFNLQKNIKQQINRIKNHLQERTAKVKSYSRFKELLKNIDIFLIQCELSPIITAELQYYKVNLITTVKSLYQSVCYSNRRKIVIGNFSQQQLLMLALHKSIYSINLKKNLNIHSHLLQILQKIGQAGSSLEGQLWQVTSFGVSMSQSGIIHQDIKHFKQQLGHMGNRLRHMLIMHMQDYTQQRQQLIKYQESLKNIKFQVYLSYGEDFICRSGGKYAFTKKQKLLQIIKAVFMSRIQDQTATQSNQLRQTHSDLQAMTGQQFINLAQFKSAPLYFQNPPQLLVVVPKALPYSTFLNRTIQSYHILQYTHISQLYALIRHLTSSHFALIFSLQKLSLSDCTNRDCFELVESSEVSQGIVRMRLQSVIDRLGLMRKEQFLTFKRKSEAGVLLFDEQDSSHRLLVSQMQQLFGNTKVIGIGKNKFRAMKKSYVISSDVVLYELGRAQISHSKRLKTLMDVYKLYMSPHLQAHEFDSRHLVFPCKQFLIKKILGSTRGTSIYSRMTQSSPSPKRSPFKKNTLGKQQLLNATGLTVLESASVNKLMKKTLFNNELQLLGLSLPLLNKGQILLVILLQIQFDRLRSKMPVDKTAVIWMVVVEEPEKIVLRCQNIIFCEKNKLQQTVSSCIDKFKKEKERKIQLVDKNHNFYSQESKQDIEVGLISKLPNIKNENNTKNVDNTDIKICVWMTWDPQTKFCDLNNLRSTLFFGNQMNYHRAITSIHYSQPSFSLSELAEEKPQRVIILCKRHNKRFVQQSLKIVEENQYLLVLFDQLVQVLCFSQVAKYLIVIEQHQQLQVENALLVREEQTALSFSKRIKFFVDAIRNFH